MALRVVAHAVALRTQGPESVEMLTLRCIDEPFDPQIVECISDGYAPATCLRLRSRAHLDPL